MRLTIQQKQLIENFKQNGRLYSSIYYPLVARTFDALERRGLIHIVESGPCGDWYELTDKGRAL